MEKHHTPGNWSTNPKRTDVVITDRIPENYPGHTGHDDTKFYGGFLIAESILNEADAKLMAAAPEMLESLKAARAIFVSQGIGTDHPIVGEQFQKIVTAIHKAESYEKPLI